MNNVFGEEFESSYFRQLPRSFSSCQLNNNGSSAFGINKGQSACSGKNGTGAFCSVVPHFSAQGLHTPFC